MSKSNDEQPILPLFHLSEKFPDAKSIFTISIPVLEDFKRDALIVLDTNVLLIPYTIEQKGLDDIKATYQNLIDETRLFIPAQVAREFAKNRGEKIQNLFHELTLKQNTNVKKSEYRVLEPFPEYSELLKIEDELTTKLKEYRKVVSSILNHIRLWRWNDPVSNLYRELFKPEIIVDTSFSTDDIKKDLERRLENRIPPGFKDARKDDRGIGDIIIWNTILELGKNNKRPLIFVTGDEKNDWMLRSDNESLYPNFELIDEFSRVSEGQPLHIMKFSELLNLFDVKEEVVTEVKKEEIDLTNRRLESHKEFMQFVNSAERSVLSWLRKHYSSADIIENRGFPDFTVESATGEKIGVEVKTIRGKDFLSLAMRFQDVFYRAYFERDEGNLTDFVLVVVFENEETVWNAIPRLERLRYGDLKAGTISGYINSDGDFIVIHNNYS